MLHSGTPQLRLSCGGPRKFGDPNPRFQRMLERSLGLTNKGVLCYKESKKQSSSNVVAAAWTAGRLRAEGSMDLKSTALPGSALSIFWTAATVVIVAEIGCLARTALLTMRYGRPWVVFAGTMVGTAITMGVGIAMGDAFHQR